MDNSLGINNSHGFSWNSLIIPQNLIFYKRETICVKYLVDLSKHIQSAAGFSGNPITNESNIQILIKGITVGGFRLSEQQQILNLIKASNTMIALVRNEQFQFNKQILELINQKLAFKESKFAGIFLDYFNDPILKNQLNTRFNDSLIRFNEISNPMIRAFNIFLFLNMNHFFEIENLNTSFILMNAILLESGLLPISIPLNNSIEFIKKVQDFKLTKNGDNLIQFLYSLYPDKISIEIKQTQKLTQRLDFDDDEDAY